MAARFNRFRVVVSRSDRMVYTNVFFCLPASCISVKFDLQEKEMQYLFLFSLFRIPVHLLYSLFKNIFFLIFFSLSKHVCLSAFISSIGCETRKIYLLLLHSVSPLTSTFQNASWLHKHYQRKTVSFYSFHHINKKDRRSGID